MFEVGVRGKGSFPSDALSCGAANGQSSSAAPSYSCPPTESQPGAEVRSKGASTCTPYAYLEKNAATGGKSDQFAGLAAHPSKEPQLTCPECGSPEVGKDGLRHLDDGSTIQRMRCHTCRSRFSARDKFQQVNTKTLKRSPGIHANRQVCVAMARGAKNLSATVTKTVAGEVDARIVQYEWKCRKRQLAENTIQKRRYYLSRLLRDGANLDDPDSVEALLATKYPTATRWTMVIAYRSYCKMFNIQWEPVKVKYQPKMPYIPLEEECNIFIAAMPKTLLVLCRTLFETGARIGEALKVEWQDVDAENCKIAIRQPEKGSNPRVIKVSRECIDLLMTMPRKHGTFVFNPGPRAYHGSFGNQRRKIALKLNKPQFLKIHFHSFRHIRGTFDVHNHVPLFEVKEKLGHKCISNTEKYVHWNRQLYDAKSDRYHFAAVSTVEEAGKLIETGYEFVTDMEGMKLFRKPK